MSSAGSRPVQEVSLSALAAAAERRVSDVTRQKTTAQVASEYEKRQKFRRMIDPGIMRPNAEAQAHRSLKTLLKIAENLFRDPDNEMYQKIKTTNSTIKRDLIDPKGTVEYLREMGFYPQVDNFQPYYIFNPRSLEDLQLGATILRDYLDLVSDKKARAEYASKTSKAAQEEAATKVKLASIDDRKNKLLRDELEKERRTASSSSALSPVVPSGTPEDIQMPGSGHLLGVTNDEPPSYEHLEQTE